MIFSSCSLLPVFPPVFLSAFKISFSIDSMAMIRTTPTTKIAPSMTDKKTAVSCVTMPTPWVYFKFKTSVIFSMSSLVL